MSVGSRAIITVIFYSKGYRKVTYESDIKCCCTVTFINGNLCAFKENTGSGTTVVVDDVPVGLRRVDGNQSSAQIRKVDQEVLGGLDDVVVVYHDRYRMRFPVVTRKGQLTGVGNEVSRSYCGTVVGCVVQCEPTCEVT